MYILWVCNVLLWLKTDKIVVFTTTKAEPQIKSKKVCTLYTRWCVFFHTTYTREDNKKINTKSKRMKEMYDVWRSKLCLQAICAHIYYTQPSELLFEVLEKTCGAKNAYTYKHITRVNRLSKAVWKDHLVFCLLLKTFFFSLVFGKKNARIRNIHSNVSNKTRERCSSEEKCISRYDDLLEYSA